MIGVFTSYHHDNDQHYKDALCDWAQRNQIFDDRSVKLGDISENLKSETIRRIIRDGYLGDTTVTLLLVGQATKFRKHIDWEIKSSMIDGRVNPRSGIIVVMLPDVDSGFVQASDWREKEMLYSQYSTWQTIATRSELERRFPHLPDRIIDNLLKSEQSISVTSWSHIQSNPVGFKFLIERAHEKRLTTEYCLKRPMRRANHNSSVLNVFAGFGQIAQQV